LAGHNTASTHWKTEIVATSVEMLSGRKKKEYAEESAVEPVEAEVESPA
jgi:hypothetical protein